MAAMAESPITPHPMMSTVESSGGKLRMTGCSDEQKASTTTASSKLTLAGSGMAVFQAADAFDIFTGLTADRARMLDSFDAFAAARMECAA